MNEGPYEDAPQTDPFAGMKQPGGSLTGSAPTSRIEGLTTRSQRSLTADIMERNGNIMARAEQLAHRMENLIDRLAGPRPGNPVGAPEQPEGSLHQIGYQQAIINEHLTSCERLINELETIL